MSVSGPGKINWKLPRDERVRKAFGDAWRFDHPQRAPQMKGAIPEHGHCPQGCEHPQPFEHEGKSYCGRCWHVNKALCEMVPCAPPLCEDGA